MQYRLLSNSIKFWKFNESWNMWLSNNILSWLDLEKYRGNKDFNLKNKLYPYYIRLYSILIHLYLDNGHFHTHTHTNFYLHYIHTCSFFMKIMWWPRMIIFNRWIILLLEEKLLLFVNTLVKTCCFSFGRSSFLKSFEKLFLIILWVYQSMLKKPMKFPKY